MINREKIPTPEKEDVITPEDELNNTKEALEKEDWGEVTDCLNQFSIKVAELSDEEKGSLSTKFEEVKSACQSAEVPDDYKRSVDLFLQRAEDAMLASGESI